MLEQFPDFEEHEILSVTFIEAAVEDNPHLDKGYIAKLKALPRIERDRLLGRNWKTKEGSLIDSEWLKHYTVDDGKICFCASGVQLLASPATLQAHRDHRHGRHIEGKGSRVARGSSELVCVSDCRLAA